MSNTNKLLRLNVGFIVHQTIGYSRDFSIEAEALQLPPDLRLENLSGDVRITRTGQGLLVQVRMSAYTQVECVRCLKDFLQPLQIDFTELYAFKPEAAGESGLILPENYQMDLTPLVREEMLLAVPISPVCTPDCKGLCPICGEDLNTNDHNHQDEMIDPRLSALKSLLDKKG